MSFREIPLMKLNEGTVLFHPYVSKNSFKNVKGIYQVSWLENCKTSLKPRKKSFQLQSICTEHIL